MPIDEEILKQARENPADVWFSEILKLAEQMGWTFAGGKGSHRVYKHPNANLVRDKFPIPLNFQEGKHGKAKAYQVEQLLAMATELGIIKEPATKE